MQKNKVAAPQNDFRDKWKDNQVAFGGFWKGNISNERNHLYKSTCVALQMGLMNEMPINNRFASRIRDEHIQNPFALAEALKQQHFVEHQKQSKFPHKPIFGGDLPTSVAKVTPFENQKYVDTKFESLYEQYPSIPKVTMRSKYQKQRFPNQVSHSIKTFNGEQKLQYMDSSIDLSQHDMNRVVFPQDKDKYNMNRFRQSIADQSGIFKDSSLQSPEPRDQFNSFDNKATSGIKNYKHLTSIMRDSLHHPYEWNAKQPINGRLPDPSNISEKITNKDMDRTQSLRRTASQVMQFYETSLNHSRQPSITGSPNHSQNMSLSQLHIPINSKIAKVADYQDKLGLIDKPLTQVKLPQLSSNKHQF